MTRKENPAAEVTKRRWLDIHGSVVEMSLRALTYGWLPIDDALAASRTLRLSNIHSLQQSHRNNKDVHAHPPLRCLPSFSLHVCVSHDHLCASLAHAIATSPATVAIVVRSLQTSAPAIPLSGPFHPDLKLTLAPELNDVERKQHGDQDRDTFDWEHD